MRTRIFLALLLVTACGGEDASTPPPVPPPPPAVPAAEIPPPTTEPGVTAAAGPGSTVETRSPTVATGCPATDPAARAAPGTVHRDLLASGTETLDLAGSPHRFPNGLRIADGASLRVEPCTLILVGGEGAMFDVQNGAELVAAGTEAQPIVFAYDRPGAARGAWVGLLFQSGARISSQLAWVTIEQAGRPGTWDDGAAVWIGGEPFRLDAQHVTVRGSSGAGFSVVENGGFAASATALTVEGSGDPAHATGAVRFHDAGSVATLPEGSYANNETPWIYVVGGAVAGNATWRDAGVPYRLENDLSVGGVNGAVLTLAPGSELRFAAERRLIVGLYDDGALVADGQSEEGRIVLGSARSTPDAGDWAGIYFAEHTVRAATRLAWVEIRHAGRADDLVGPMQCGEPHLQGPLEMALDLGAVISHVRVTSMPPTAAAIVRGYASDAPTSYLDAALGNELAGGACQETFVSPSTGCPDPVPACP